MQKLKKRKLPSKRKLFAVSSPPPPKRARSIKRDESNNMNIGFVAEQHGDHIHDVEEKALTSRCNPVIEKLKSELEGSKRWNNEQSNCVLSYTQVKDNDKLLKFYTWL